MQHWSKLDLYPGQVSAAELAPSKLGRHEIGRRSSGLLTVCGLPCDVILTDMDGDGVPMKPSSSSPVRTCIGGPRCEQMPEGGWLAAGTLPSPHCPGDLDALKAGKFSDGAAEAAEWKGCIGGHDVPLSPAGPGEQECTRPK